MKSHTGEAAEEPLIVTIHNHIHHLQYSDFTSNLIVPSRTTERHISKTTQCAVHDPAAEPSEAILHNISSPGKLQRRAQSLPEDRPDVQVAVLGLLPKELLIECSCIIVLVGGAGKCWIQMCSLVLVKHADAPGCCRALDLALDTNCES